MCDDNFHDVLCHAMLIVYKELVTCLLQLSAGMLCNRLCYLSTLGKERCHLLGLHKTSGIFEYLVQDAHRVHELSLKRLKLF